MPVPVPRTESNLAAVDLFCGAGGLSQGLRQAGVRIVAGSDNDPDACATFARNFPDAASLCGDVRDPAVREQVTQLAEGVDIIVGGPPCQAFSQVRNHARLIDDPRNRLYREFVRLVGAAAPAAFLMENVPGLAQMGALEQVMSDLSLDGEYKVESQVVDAADFGVPQTRKRLIFLGVHRSLAESPPVLAGTGATAGIQLARLSSSTPSYGLAVRPGAETLAERLANPDDLGLVTADQAIGDLRLLSAGRRDDLLGERDLPDPSSAYQRLMRAKRAAPMENVSVPRCQPDTALRLTGIPAGGNYRDLSENLRDRYLTGAKWGPHNGSGRLGRAHYYAYRRLHPDIWAWTLNTKGDSAYHYAATRCLSVREFARLQSFPDHFLFTTDPRKGPLPGRIDGGAAHSRYRQAGNAVPPLLAAAAGAALVEAVLSARGRRESA
jgi:DNA (cytosine-5)-methyltransferase 1